MRALTGRFWMLHRGSDVRKRGQKGFTLIEMLVVVAILVILAGFILPKLDRVQLKANKGVAAANMSGVSRYIQTYRILHNVYPDRWDSLLDGTALKQATLNPPAPGIDPQLTNGWTDLAVEPHKLTTMTIPGDGALRSLTRMGITTVLDWDTAGSQLPGDR